MKRFLSIWFPNLMIDWFSRQNLELRKLPVVLRISSHGRMIVTAVNDIAQSKGIESGMVLADARAIIPELHVIDDRPELVDKLLTRLAEWCIRFTPCAAIDPPDGILLDVTGCSHLWGGDVNYVNDIIKKIKARGYNVRAAIADTIGCAWAMSRYGNKIEADFNDILELPAQSLRIEAEAAGRLHRLGLHRVRQFVSMPRHSLLRRFGNHLLFRIDQAIGKETESIIPVCPIEPYTERLPCMEPIVTAEGIAIGLERLLAAICERLYREQKGLRLATLKCYRVDGKIEQISIGTNRPSHNPKHLFKLFELKLPGIEPHLGIELFVLEAPKVEDHIPQQEKLWGGSGGLEDERLSELIDRLSGRVGADAIHRYLPDEHYWPERSIRLASSIVEPPAFEWKTDRLRPMQLLKEPEPIQVTAPIPDYPPMLFIYKNQIHQIVKADGPERIEQEWWLQRGQHRDYYRVEDEEGRRYWIFRLGHYHDKIYQWFIHGFFA